MAGCLVRNGSGCFSGILQRHTACLDFQGGGALQDALAVFQGFCSAGKALFLGVFTCHPTMLQETMMGSESQGSWFGTIKNEHRSIKH